MDIVDRHTAQIRDDTHISNEIIVIENVPVKLGHLSIKWIIVTGPKCIGGEDTRLPGKFKGRTEVNVPTIGPPFHLREGSEPSPIETGVPIHSQSHPPYRQIVRPG